MTRPETSDIVSHPRKGCPNGYKPCNSAAFNATTLICIPDTDNLNTCPITHFKFVTSADRSSGAYNNYTGRAFGDGLYLAWSR